MDFCKFAASLIYIISSRIDKTMQRPFHRKRQIEGKKTGNNKYFRVYLIQAEQGLERWLNG